MPSEASASDMKNHERHEEEERHDPEHLHPPWCGDVFPLTLGSLFDTLLSVARTIPWISHESSQRDGSFAARASVRVSVTRLRERAATQPAGR